MYVYEQQRCSNTDVTQSAFGFTLNSVPELTGKEDPMEKFQRTNWFIFTWKNGHYVKVLAVVVIPHFAVFIIIVGE